ncbi:MAG TPA: type I-U CRISPR-associated protein Csb2 [Nitrospiraceae bacterium]|nr:type I-U CRISPR-associated protein Csb2 [Nitrospiraceae bacterium]
MALSIRVQFLTDYSGREWPPSPGRVFKALVCAARGGWAAPRRRDLDACLRAIEEHPTSPVVAAPDAIMRYAGQRRFLPNNSTRWPPRRQSDPKPGSDLDEERLFRWGISSPPIVWYHWPAVDSALVPQIARLARHVPSIGKGEDFAAVDATDQPPPDDLKWWREAAAGEKDTISLEIPEPGCVDVCDAAFWRADDQSTLPTLGVRPVLYSSNQTHLTSDLVFVLALRAGRHRRSWDARLLLQVVGPIRNLLDDVRGDITSTLASSEAERRRLKAVVDRVILGHDERGDAVREPHLAVLPIPSLVGPYPDGRIRRVALVGFHCAQDPIRRAMIDLAHILLHGRELVDEGNPTGVRVYSESDPQWAGLLCQPSRVWVSVTPVIQPANELTAAEWNRLRAARKAPDENEKVIRAIEKRLEKRRIELITRSVYQAIGTDEARVASVEVIRGGPIAGVHVATQYRVTGYLSETPRLHVRLVFDRPVQGPLAIGRGRHVGFGLMWPDTNDRG